MPPTWPTCAASPAPGGLLAKIEKPAGLRNLEAILDVSDGLMVARAIWAWNWRPRMCLSPRRPSCGGPAARRPGDHRHPDAGIHDEPSAPTRAEASDVANGVYEGRTR